MIHEIPLFGPPLAGKSSFLAAAAWASGTGGRYVESVLRTSDPFNGALIRRFEVQLHHSADTMRLWCMPGGSAPEWPLQIVTQPSAALFVADAQQSRHDANAEFWQPVREVVAIDRWFVVLTKCDIASREEQQHALPLELKSRPRIRVAGHDERAIANHAQAFLSEVVFPSIARGG